MKEKDIKEFDRTIEQMMNENEVTPPFGIWNRISAQIDTAPVAEPPVTVGHRLPKGLVLGFVAGALLVGSSITAWMAYNGRSLTQPVSNINITTTSEAVQSSLPEAAPVQELPRIEKAITPPAMMQAKHLSVKKSAQKTTTAHGNNTGSLEELTLATLSASATAPLTVIHAAPQPQSYYFPPIDVEDNQRDSNILNGSNAVEKNLDDDEREADSKRNNVSSNDQRVKFRKKRKSGWSYPHIINRNRKHKNGY